MADEGPDVQSAPMSQLFQRKPIAQLVEDTESANGLKRSLGAGDLIMGRVEERTSSLWGQRAKRILVMR